jgi:hypothetical protein
MVIPPVRTVIAAVQNVGGVLDVHDLSVWIVGSGVIVPVARRHSVRPLS